MAEIGEKIEFESGAAKRVSGALTTASVLAYAAGYIVVRCRAHALGTDPGFALVDQIYVWAGFRFALATLTELLYLIPVLLLVTAAAWALAQRLPPQVRNVSQWIALIAIAAVTLQSASTLTVDGALLNLGERSAPLRAAIVGEGLTGFLITLGATLLAALTLLWLYTRYRHNGLKGPLTHSLLIVALMQLLLLPAQNGIFIAEHSARALQRLPEEARGVIAPAWLLDRGSERASLLARTPEGAITLVTVKVEALDGIPINRVASLDQAVLELRKAPTTPAAGETAEQRGTP